MKTGTKIILFAAQFVFFILLTFTINKLVTFVDRDYYQFLTLIRSILTALTIFSGLLFLSSMIYYLWKAETRKEIGNSGPKPFISIDSTKTLMLDWRASNRHLFVSSNKDGITYKKVVADRYIFAEDGDIKNSEDLRECMIWLILGE